MRPGGNEGCAEGDAARQATGTVPWVVLLVCRPAV